MKATEQTIQQIDRALRKTADKFPANEEATVMTDIHIRVSQDSGEVLTFDDDDNELMRCVVEQWIDNKDDDFYEQIVPVLRRVIDKNKDMVEGMSILKPFSFVLEDETSPGEIDDEEAQYLYDMIKGDGQVDGTEKALLLNIKAKSKNFPKILEDLL